MFSSAYVSLLDRPQRLRVECRVVTSQIEFRMQAVTGLPKAVDCHAHLFDASSIPQPIDDDYRYSKIELGTFEQYRAVLAVHGFSHAVVVNPYGAYGNDNAHMLACIARSNGQIKGVATIAPDASDHEVARLVEGGVIGIRFSLQYGSSASAMAQAEPLLARARELNWFVQVVGPADDIARVLPAFRKARVWTLIDHCGRPDSKIGLSQSSFQDILAFGRDTNAMVKLSAPFRFVPEPWPYDAAKPFVEALTQAFSLDRCIWGSDWPFSRTGKRMDYGPVFACLERYLPNADDRRRVLWDNPARLFGFT